MNDIPDATTVAYFRERLGKAGVIEELFQMFEGYLRVQGFEARGGQIIDATLVPVPKHAIPEKKTTTSSLVACQMDGKKTQIDSSKRIYMHTG